MEKKESYRSLLEMGPLILFFGVNYFYGIFAGTAVLVISTIIALIISWYFFKNIPMLAAFGCLAVILFGGLTLFFDNVFIIKPYSSRPANSEKYVLCKSFKINENYFQKYTEVFKNIITTKNLFLLDDSIPYKFIKHITDYNKFYTDRQILYIQNTLTLIKKIKDNEVFDKNLYLKELYNNNKKYAVNWCNYYNINIKN